MLKSVALAGAFALGFMALPAEAAVTILEDGALSVSLGTLSDPSSASADAGHMAPIRSDSTNADRRPRLMTASSSAKPFELPEPATWGMILAGLGTIGYTMRRQSLRDASFA